jgi:predicted NUDIX family NTP pyrophosphohydrolase
MPAVSAGILLYVRSQELRVLLAHPGGPYFSRKDSGSWTIPKGLVNHDEDLESAARREFKEELGWSPPGVTASLGHVKLRSGKIVHGFAAQSLESEAVLLEKFQPGTFSLEWPRNTGRLTDFPEIDRIGLFSLDEASSKLAAAQLPFLDRLCAVVS